MRERREWEDIDGGDEGKEGKVEERGRGLKSEVHMKLLSTCTLISYTVLRQSWLVQVPSTIPCSLVPRPEMGMRLHPMMHKTLPSPSTLPSTYSELPDSLLLAVHRPPSLHRLLLEEVHQSHFPCLLSLSGLLWKLVQTTGGGISCWLGHRTQVEVECAWRRTVREMRNGNPRISLGTG